MDLYRCNNDPYEACGEGHTVDRGNTVKLTARTLHDISNKYRWMIQLNLESSP